ncbi:MAG: FkbM family methyltransferase [Chitinophagaceae bacterium]
MIKQAILTLIQSYVDFFPLPKRGQKYFLRMLAVLDALPHKFIRKLKGGFLMYLANEDHIEKELFWHGSYESKETETLLQFISHQNVFIDAGANSGYYSLLIASKYSDCLVHAFEPASSSYQNLQSNILLNKLSNIIALQKALSNKTGCKHLYLSAKDNTGMSSFTRAENASGTIEEVKTIPLELYATQNKLSNIAAVKIDVEGAELEVLEGLKSLLSLQRPVIAIELSEELQNRSGYSIWHIHKYFQEMNYKSYKASAPCLLQQLSQHEDCDLAFFVPAEKKLPAGISVQSH